MSWFRKAPRHEKTKQSSKSHATDYFGQAKSWADDYYATAVASRNRYKLAFYFTLLLCGILAIAIAMMVPLQRTELAVVHQGVNGNAWVSMTPRYAHLKPNWLRTQSNIAHYIEVRESYDPDMYQYFSKMTSLLSSNAINRQYNKRQAASQSPVNRYGIHATVSVQINDVILIDSASRNHNGSHLHHNLAQVNYTKITTNLKTGQISTEPYRADVSWQYRGIPQNPFAQLHDWDGFEITQFTATPVNLN